MFNRVVMDVMYMVPIIVVVPYSMLPEPALPDSQFAFVLAGIGLSQWLPPVGNVSL